MHNVRDWRGKTENKGEEQRLATAKVQTWKVTSDSDLADINSKVMACLGYF